jgi:hypothetical protein
MQKSGCVHTTPARPHLSLTPHTNTNTTPPAPLSTSTLIPHVQKPEKGEERRKEGKRRREEEE